MIPGEPRRGRAQSPWAIKLTWRHGSLATKVERGKQHVRKKPGSNETAKFLARRGPIGMVKSELTEPKYPFCKDIGSEMADDIRGFPEPVGPFQTGEALLGCKIASSDHKDTKWAPNPV
jgi:hypothetical protein